MNPTELVPAAAEGLDTMPMARGCPFDAPRRYAELRAEHPVSKVWLRASGTTAWLLTRYEDMRAVLRDSRFSSDHRNPAYPRILSAGPDPFGVGPPLMITMDGGEHMAARRAVTGEFTVSQVHSLRPRIQQIADEVIDAMLVGPRPVDLVKAVSLPVPTLVICELLGVPYNDHGFFQELTRVLTDYNCAPHDRTDAQMKMMGFLDRLVSSREAEPGDDLISRQAQQQRDRNGSVDHPGLVALAFGLLIAGHETTANTISVGVLTLLANPGQLNLIKADPSKTPAAVDEILRLTSIADLSTARFALEDVTIRGVLIRKGEGVIASELAANRDEAVFPNPDVLDIERDAHHHIAFGYGPHQCLGQHLARAELRIVFDTLFGRIPELRLAVDTDEIKGTEAFLYGIHEMPVTW